MSGWTGASPSLTTTPCCDRLRSTSFRRTPPDRKSTRLNSSHLVISYAAFCLKKNIIILANNAIQADVAERYTRLSQKQVPKRLRVRISPSAPPHDNATSKAAIETTFGVSNWL